MREALRAGTLANKVVPILCGSAFKNIGIQPVLDAVAGYLPAPAEGLPVKGLDPRDGREVLRPLDASAPLCALIFKTIWDSQGDLAFARLYSGRLKVSDQVYNPRTERTERINRLYVMHADERKPLDEAVAGDIVAVVGLKNTATGDTLCPKGDALALEGIRFPEPVISMSIEPFSLKDKDELVRVLELLSRDDPSFTWRQDDETGQMIIAGVGELHLEVLRHRIERDFRMQVRIGEPRVAYRQTVTGTAEAEAVFDKVLPNKTLYAGVRLAVEPDPSARPLTLVNAIPKGSLPPLFVAAMVASIESSARGGTGLGFPITGVKVTLLEGLVREQGSEETAFSHAAHLAFEQALEAAGAVILEPIMDFEIVCPSEFLQGVNGDLAGRRAQIRSLNTESDPAVLRGLVPLAEIFGYSTTLRSLSQGRAAFSVEPRSYEPVPPAVARTLA